jgi:hypothetical protein
MDCQDKFLLFLTNENFFLQPHNQKLQASQVERISAHTPNKRIGNTSTPPPAEDGAPRTHGGKGARRRRGCCGGGDGRTAVGGNGCSGRKTCSSVATQACNLSSSEAVLVAAAARAPPDAAPADAAVTSLGGVGIREPFRRAAASKPRRPRSRSVAPPTRSAASRRRGELRSAVQQLGAAAGRGDGDGDGRGGNGVEKPRPHRRRPRRRRQRRRAVLGHTGG